MRDKTREDTISARPGDKGLTGALADNGYLMRPTGKWRELVFEGSQNRVGRETEWRWKRDRITWESFENPCSRLAAAGEVRQDHDRLIENVELSL